MIDFTMLTALDFAVFAIIALSTLFAMWRGFIGSFLSLLGWVLSIYLAYYLFPEVKPLIESKVKNQFFVLVAGHTGLMIAFLILFGILNMFLTTALAAMTKGFFDRSLGAAFGVVRGGLITSFFFLVLTATMAVFYGSSDGTKVAEDDIMPDWIKTSQTYSYLKFGKTIVSDFIPDTFYSRIEETYEGISTKTLEQRFVESLTKKIGDNLPDDVKEQLEISGKRDANSMSQEEYETKHAKDVIDAYKEAKKAGIIDNNEATDSEVQQLEKTLTKK